MENYNKDNIKYLQAKNASNKSKDFTFTHWFCISKYSSHLH